ncbi:sugar ABC transporter substrate-binding protein [Anaeromicropila herbilytica]|uniref:Maltodextrin-binding protein n=1 Tax=Anaeromicropila herbilytica TaxID=2785025 RepID=A0A7R7IE02_9FIRM|nr:maltose ABC transporter substrate-binding protein [Anaeromicropila herbilytica]BCN30563.1 cyclodextrin-binding protein [Anaeromicropila herbilytica]
MKKRILSVVMAVTLVGTMMTGCGKKSDDKKDSTSSTKTESTDSKTVDLESKITKDDITLKVWESANGPDKFIKQAGDAFTKKYPNIKIEFVNVEVGDSTSQIALDGPAGVGPDLFAAPHDKLGELVTGGHVLPTVNPDDIKSKVLESCSKAVTYDNTMYGYPVSAETYALFYNKDYIKEAPKSFDDVVKFSKEFNTKDRYGFMMDVSSGYYTIIFTTADNNRLFGANGTDTKNTNINSAASVEGMKFFQSLRSVLDISSADLTTATCDAAFLNKKAAMYITGLWNVSQFKEAGLNFGVAPIPTLPGQNTPPASFAGTRTMFVSAYSTHPNEANLFAQFLLSDEMQKLRFEVTGALPSVNVEVDSPYVAGLLEQLKYAYPTPSIPQMGKYWDAMNAASANIWDGADIQKELDACNTAILAQ